MKYRSVFEEYAHEYGLITNEPARAAYHLNEVKALIKRFRPTSVLDAGCAIGLTVSLFAQLGVSAVGLDRSRRMIAEAKKKYDASGLPLTFRVGRFEGLPRALNSKFDMVVCLANSISGVGTTAALRQSLGGFKRVLKPGGNLVLQALNYAAIKEGELFPIKATQRGKIGYLRFARRRGKKQEIVVVRLDMTIRPFSFEPFCHEFDNFTPQVLEQSVRKAGFGRIQKFGNLTLDARFRRTSRDLVLVATRS